MRSPPKCLFGLMVFLVLFGAAQAISVATHEFGELPKDIPLGQCGVFSLYSVLRSNEIEAPYNEMFSEITANKYNEVSLKQLAQYARKKGMHCEGIAHPTVGIIRNSLRNGANVILQITFERDRSPASHIVALFQGEGDSVLVLDYPRKFTIDDDSLSQWLGQSEGMLILSKKPIQIPVGYRISSMPFVSKVAGLAGIIFLIASAMMLMHARKKARQR